MRRNRRKVSPDSHAAEASPGLLCSVRNLALDTARPTAPAASVAKPPTTSQIAESLGLPRHVTPSGTEREAGSNASALRLQSRRRP